MPKYWGKQIFTQEFPRSGSKAKDGEKREKEDCNNNSQLRIANATSGGARKAAWANSASSVFPKWMKCIARKKKREEKKSMKTVASYVCNRHHHNQF